MEIEFTWDPTKARSNPVKHGVSFETASEVFFDRNLVIVEDCEVDGELRPLAIGYTRLQSQLPVVAFVDRSTDDSQEIIHIISARKAEHYEQTTYSDQFA